MIKKHVVDSLQTFLDFFAVNHEHNNILTWNDFSLDLPFIASLLYFLGVTCDVV